MVISIHGNMEGGTILKRSLSFLFIFYSFGVIMALLAGSTLIAHVDPVSKCILFSYQEEGKLHYGSEYYCHILGYSYILLVILIFIQIYLTFKHRREVSKCLKFAYKSSGVIKFPQKIICIHIALTVVVIFLTVFITTGYGIACSNFSSHISDLIRQKYHENEADVRREESLSDTDLEDDQQFWRYVGGIQNAFGGELYDERISCGNVMTDPDIYKSLQDTHYKKYAGYFGYWYHQDIYSFDSQAEATTTNALIDGCLGGAWLSVIIWMGSLIFILVQRRKLHAEITETDHVSVYSASSINNNIIKQGSLGGSSNKLMHQTLIDDHHEAIYASRRDMDNLALESLHLQKETSSFLAPPQRGDIQREKQHPYQAGVVRRASSGSTRMAPATGILRTGSHPGLYGNRSGSIGSQVTHTYPTGSHDESYCNRTGSNTGSHRNSLRTGSQNGSVGYRNGSQTGYRSGRGSAASDRNAGIESQETEIM